MLDSSPHKYSILVKASSSQVYDEAEEVEGVSLKLQFQYPDTYPDVPPLMEFVDVENLDEDTELDELRKRLEQDVSNT